MLKTRQDAIEAAMLLKGLTDIARLLCYDYRRSASLSTYRASRKIRSEPQSHSYAKMKTTILHISVEAIQTVLHTAHSQCFDGPDCMLSRPSPHDLSRFQGPAGDTTGKQRVFTPHRSPRSLKSYFAIAPRFLAYLRHVEEDSHGPEAVVEMTVEQQRAWQAVIDSASQLHGELRHSSSSEDEVREWRVRKYPRPAVSVSRRSTCQLLDAPRLPHIAVRPYRSPLVSFCAMLSIQPTTGSWMKPGSYSSDLWIVIWIVQLITFYHSAQQERRGKGQPLILIRECCEVYLQQANEIPIGEILRWRLLLFHVRDHTVGDQRAVWNDENDTVIYIDVTLRIDYIPTLLRTEYRRCQRILYKQLMLDASRFQHMSAILLYYNEGVAAREGNCVATPLQSLGSDSLELVEVL
ncbi:hypothetical protein LTR17_022897 [Elasticomyces elasticus]|nr:hypothetical protein LTR17_022897 [Elasticomyces elasticus]